MAGKKVKNEVESIRTELNELTEAIYALREYVRIESAATAASRIANIAPSAHPSRIPGDRTGGEVTSSGFTRLTTSDDQPLTLQWSAREVTVATVMEDDSEQLARLLAAIGHRQRLAILKAILANPRSASELVSDLKLGTSGAAYHHLNVLQAADLVMQEDRGIFAIQPSRVGTLLSIMASPHIVTVTDTAPDAVADTVVDNDIDAPPMKSKSKKKAGDA